MLNIIYFMLQKITFTFEFGRMLSKYEKANFLGQKSYILTFFLSLKQSFFI